MNLTVAVFLLSLAPASHDRPSPEIFYLAVGNEQYARPLKTSEKVFGDFKGAALSVRRVATQLERLGAKFGIRLLSRDDQVVSADDIRVAVAELVSAAKVSRNPFLVVYITGHGQGEGIGWHHFSIPGSATAPADFGSIEQESQRLILASALVETLQSSRLDYMVLLDSCYPAKDQQFSSPVLTATAQQNLRDIAKVVRFMNQFKQPQPVVFSAPPGETVVAVPDPLDPGGPYAVGPLARRLVLATKDDRKHRRPLTLTTLVKRLADRDLDEATRPGVTHARDMNAAVKFRWGRHADLQVIDRGGTAKPVGESFRPKVVEPVSYPTTRGRPSSSMTLEGVPGEYLSDGKRLSVSGARYAVVGTVLPNAYGVEISFDDADGFPFAEIRLHGAPGEPLKARTYRRVKRAMVDDDRPAMDVSIDSRGCNETAGWFEVTTLRFDPKGLGRLKARFELRCDDGAPIRGKVSFQAR